MHLSTHNMCQARIIGRCQGVAKWYLNTTIMSQAYKMYMCMRIVSFPVKFYSEKAKLYKVWMLHYSPSCVSSWDTTQRNYFHISHEKASHVPDVLVFNRLFICLFLRGITWRELSMSFNCIEREWQSVSRARKDRLCKIVCTATAVYCDEKYKKTVVGVWQCMTM